MPRHPAVRAAAWILLPLALGLLYALIHPFAAPMPTAANVVPEDAILTQRFRDLAALDRAFLGGGDAGARPSELVAAQRNLAGWVGVDPERPIFLVQLPRRNRPDASMLILPVADAAALRARFEDPDFFLQQLQIRQPQHLGIRGDWAGVAWDPDETQRLGGGGLVPEDRGETWAIAADVPALVDFALASPREAPFATILDALGFEPLPPAEAGGAVEFHAPRVLRIREAWGRATLWAYFDAGRITIELEPRAPGLAASLRALAAAGSAEEPPAPAAPRDAAAWVRIRAGAARGALLDALALMGVPLPPAAEAEGSALRRADARALLVWGAPDPEHPAFFNLGAAGAAGALEGIGALDPRLPAAPVEARAWEGALPFLLRADPAARGTPPPVQVARGNVGEWEVLYLGPDVRRAAARFEAPGRASAATPPETPEGFVPLATFGLDATRARALLGAAVGPGGLFAALEGGDLVGTIATDGRVLRLDARRAESPR